MEAIPIAEIAAAVASWASDAAAWSAEALVERDLAESFTVGVHRWALANKVTPLEIANVARLAVTLVSFDDRLAMTMTRTQAESRVGLRVALLGDHAWTAGLPDDDGHFDDVPPDASIEWHPAMASAEPSDRAVTGYIRDGMQAHHVEGFAARVPRFAEALVWLFEMARDDGEQVSLLARRWLHTQKATIGPLVLAVLPRRVLAAAMDMDAHGSRSIQLGALGVAQGRIVATAWQVTLIVYAPMGALREISLGAHVTTAPEATAATERWIVVAGIESPLRLQIVNADGSIAFSEMIALTEESA